MTIYIILLAIVLVLGNIMTPNQTQKKKYHYILIVFGVLILFTVLRKYTVGRDLEYHYYNTFLRLADLSMSQAIGSTSYDIGFVAFYKLISLFTHNPQWMIGIHGAFVVGVTGWFIYRNSDDVVLSTFLFVAANAWFVDLSILRQAMAVAMGMILVEVWKKKNWKWLRYILALLCVVLATSLHASGIIIVLFPLLEHLPFKRNMVILSVLLNGGAYVFYNYLYQFGSRLFFFGRNFASYYEDSDYAGAGLNLYSIYELALPLLCFVLACWVLVYCKGKRKLVQTTEKERESNMLSDHHLLYLVLLLVLCRLLRFRINLISRMAHYFIPFMWILYPRAIKCLKIPENKLLIRSTLYIVVTACFLWIGYHLADQYWGVVPYQFMWE